MEINPTRMCELLVGLPEVSVLAVDDVADGPIRVVVESLVDQGWCRECGCRAVVKDRPVVEFVDLPCFGRPARLVWRKTRWRCREQGCPVGSWTVSDPRIARAAGGVDGSGGAVGDTAGREVRAVGERGRRRARL